MVFGPRVKFRKNLKANDIAQINTAQEEIRSELKNIVLKSNELAGQLTDSQVKTVNEAYDFLTTSTTQINQIKASNKYSRDIEISGFFPTTSNVSEDVETE